MLLCVCTFAALLPASGQLLQPGAPAPIPAPAPTPAPSAVPQNPAALKFDAESKDYSAKPGESTAPFVFHVTNTSPTEISINNLRTSCGCTVAQLPSQPYKLEPGSNVAINVSVDLRGKMGMITKSISVDSSVGFKSLLVRVNIPQPAPSAVAGITPGAGMADRAKNIQTALADRQAVFKGQCAECHVDKAKGKMGKELFVAACGICHDTEHRAAMVPDLKVPRSSRDLAFWQKWIMEGKPGTLMPAFAAAQGGPLTQEQIDSLTIYAYQNFPKQAPPVTARAPMVRPPTVPPSIVPPPPVPHKN